MEENPVQRSNDADLRIEGTGKTVADAEAQALAKIKEVAGEIDTGDVELQVIDEGSKGFFGVGSNLARVEARLTAAGEEGGPEAPAAGEAESGTGVETEAPARLKLYLEKVVAAFGLEATVEVTEEEENLVGNVNGGDLGIFIGRHGQTIDALQYLANVIVYRGLDDRKRVVVDAEDYRERRTEALHSLAERGVNEIEANHTEYEFKPMSAAERRIIHLYLQDREGVETASEGREPYRRVIIYRSGNYDRD